jgi:hypothetical protein
MANDWWKRWTTVSEVFYVETIEGRASLDYDEEVHQSRVLRGWSDMIGYEMGSSLVMFYIMVKISLVENFKVR